MDGVGTGQLPYVLLGLGGHACGSGPA
ncbi:hypothetical protein STAN_0423 [Streptomyces sp. CBMAI 2042]|nr:hypothetical protein STAN_0423 [Streptomyces sp. CBMAI 2042]